jgi:mRNA interferase RelE/StbE
LACKVLWHDQALDDLKSLDRSSARKLIERIKNHLSESPEKLGKPLKGVLRGLHRYRFGDYRVIYTIDRAENTVYIMHIGHRKDVYK